MRPVIIPASAEPVRFDVTGWSIGFFGGLITFAGPATIVWCARLNGFL